MIQYFMNPKRNQVVCVLNDKHTGRSFKGVAKCSPDDEFNAEFGKKLAFLRAQEKEIIYNLSVMSNEYDAEAAIAAQHHRKAAFIRSRALHVIDRGHKVANELKEMLK